MNFRQFVSETCTEDQLSTGSDQRIVVKARNQNVTITELTPLEGSYFERKLDDTSVAEVYAVADSPECCDALGHVFLGQEIEWWRDGCLQWAGVIVNLKWTGTGVYIQAVDFTSLWANKYMPNLNLVGQDATAIVAEIHNQVVAENNINTWELLLRNTGEPIDFRTYETECRTGKELIDELADYVIDYTAYGRKVIVGPADIFPSVPYFLSDDDFVSTPIIEARGAQYGFATRIIAKGGNGIIEKATAPNRVLDIYGLVERAVNFEHITSRDDLIKAAERSLALYSSPYYLNLSEGSPQLREGSSIPLKGLIPGLKIGMTSESSCLKLALEMRLLNVRNDADGQVSVSLEPVGAVSDESTTAPNLNSGG